MTKTKAQRTKAQRKKKGRKTSGKKASPTIMTNAGICLSCMLIVNNKFPTASQGDIVSLPTPHFSATKSAHPTPGGYLCQGSSILVVEIPVGEYVEVWDEIKGIEVPVEGSGLGSVWRHIVAAILVANPSQLKQLQVDNFIHPEILKNPTLAKAITARIAEAA